MNPTPQLRAEQLARLNEAGPRFIDPTVIIGLDCRIWHFAVLLANVRLGDHVSIGSHCEIGRGTIVGDFSRIGYGTFLPADSLVGDHVFIGPSCTFCDDRFPRVNNTSYTPLPPRIADNVSIGAGCVILPGIHIGTGAIIGAGSVVTRNVDPHQHVRGEPARRKSLSYVSRAAFAMADSSQ